MKRIFKWNIRVIVILFVFAFVCNLGLLSLNTVAAHPAQTKSVQLHKVDFSGVYALPEGVCLKDVLLDGQPASYVVVKDGTEVDVWGARANSRVEAVIFK
ncbi:MAG: hypothetical protein P4N41_12060 [Negativicutes bacterium]|nr:hypothetical protein [Negativicutes bacterium]